jgi:hypothetical protein
MKMQLVVGKDLFCPQKNCLDAIHVPKKENGRFLEKQRISKSKIYTRLRQYPNTMVQAQPFSRITDR